jgi:hypothetical protein
MREQRFARPRLGVSRRFARAPGHVRRGTGWGRGRGSRSLVAGSRRGPDVPSARARTVGSSPALLQFAPSCCPPGGRRQPWHPVGTRPYGQTRRPAPGRGVLRPGPPLPLVCSAGCSDSTAGARCPQITRWVPAAPRGGCAGLCRREGARVGRAPVGRASLPAVPSGWPPGRRLPAGWRREWPAGRR